MEISFSELTNKIKRHLSVIGKRLYDKEGKNLFSNITVSTLEDPIFEQYIAEAAQNVEAVLRQLVSVFSLSGSKVTMTLVNSRGNTDYDDRCKELVTSYIIAYSTSEYLAMAHPEIAAKYVRQTESDMQSLVAYVYHKNPPTV